MEKNECIEKITAIGTCEDDVERRTLLADLQTQVAADYDSFTAANTKADELTAEVTQLQENNMKLFLQVGSMQQDNNNDSGSGSGSSGTDENEKMSFDDLFDEKGGLK